MKKRYTSKKSFTYEIYAGTSKAAHKVFQQRDASSFREFPILHNLQLFVRKLWLKIGCVFNQAYYGKFDALPDGFLDLSIFLLSKKSDCLLLTNISLL